MSRALEAVGDFIGKRPKLSILLVLTITALAIFSVAYNGMNSSFNNEDFMPENEATIASAEIQSTFSTSYGVTVLLKSESNDLLTQEAFLTVLQAEKGVMDNATLASYLATASTNPYSSVISPVDIIATALLMSQNESVLASINATAVPTYDNMIKLMNVVDTPSLKMAIYGLMNSPATPEYVKAALPRMMTKDFDPNSTAPMAKGALVMYSFNKGIVGVMVAPIDLEKGLKAALGTGDEQTVVFLMGNALISDEINKAAMDSVTGLFPIAIVAIILILVFIYRDTIDTLMGLVGLILAIIWMYGFGAAVGFSFNPMTMIVPILILGLGIDYSIHLVMRYREERADGEDPPTSVNKTIVSVGEALLVATLTTVIAFLSNVTSSMQAIAEFGILAAVGIISSFAVMILLIPSTKSLRDGRAERKGKGSKHYVKKAAGKFSMTRLNQSVGRVTHKAPWAVIGVALVVSAGMGYGAMNLDTTFNLNDFLPQQMEISKNLDFLTEEFQVSGGNSAQILVKGDVSQPDAIRAMESSIDEIGATQYVVVHSGVPQVESFLSVMYDWATNSTGPGFIDPKYDPVFAAMYDAAFVRGVNNATIGANTTQMQVQTMLGWLFSNATMDMVQILSPGDSGYSALLIVDLESGLSNSQIRDLYNELGADMGPTKAAGLSAAVTGEIFLVELIVTELNNSQTQSLITTLIASLLILTAVMWLLRRSFVLGALATIPVALCVLWMWGTMFIMGIPMNVMTLMIASLTVGMGVTYGIHITHRFVEEIHEHEDIEKAVDNAVGKTGVSLLGAAMTTIVGFGIIGFSLLPPIQQFGFITALAISYSFIAAVFVLPAILVVWARYRVKHAA